MSKTIGSGLSYNTSGVIRTLLDEATGTGAGSSIGIGEVSKRNFQAYLSTSTTPTGTVDIEVSLDGTHWIVMGTITLSGSADTDGFTTDAAWKFVRGNVTAITGSSATLTLLLGE